MCIRDRDSLGRKREALAVMESIVARNPEDYQALNYVGYSLAEQGKDLDRAVLLLEAALKQAPDHAYILDSLAWAHFRRGENAEAWELVRRATSLPDGVLAPAEVRPGEGDVYKRQRQRRPGAFPAAP